GGKGDGRGGGSRRCGGEGRDLSRRGLAGRDGDQLTNAVACAWFGSPPNTDIEKKAPGTSEAFKELTILEESRDQGAPDPSILSQCTIRQGADRVSVPARAGTR